jgi:riboflavin kinase/FMN adenylyltransferase
MRILATSRGLKESVGPFAVGLGIFDGLHVGHRVLLGRVRALAQRDGIDSLAYTFNPHPARVLVPQRAPALIEPIECRLEGFASLGLVATMVERFDRELASMSAESFVDQVLGGKLQARHVVVGEGFTFGAGGQGDTQLLVRRGKAAGFETHVIQPEQIDGQVVSSTRIRELVAAGSVKDAARLLGRPYMLTGTVVRGVMRGQTLGFPTANLRADNELLPGTGVYAGTAAGSFGTFPTVVNIGYTPTFGSSTLKVEAHLLDFDADTLYGKHMVLQLIDKLREEKRFSGRDALKAQIAEDIDTARTILGQLSSPTDPR